MTLRFALEHATLRLGVVRAESVRCAPSDAVLLDKLSAAERAVQADATRFPEPVRAAIRDVLRKGGYKPTGRGKPASEFLLASALDGRLPRINNLVDINNLVSLVSAHPISIFDLDLLGDEPCVRLGRAGESYVFNASGQVMDVAGLPVIARGPEQEAVGNAVKDSMAAKVHDATRGVLAVVYGTRALDPALLESACLQLAALLREHAGASVARYTLVPV